MDCVINSQHLSLWVVMDTLYRTVHIKWKLWKYANKALFSNVHTQSRWPGTSTSLNRILTLCSTDSSGINVARNFRLPLLSTWHGTAPLFTRISSFPLPDSVASTETFNVTFATCEYSYTVLYNARNNLVCSIANIRSMSRCLSTQIHNSRKCFTS